MKYKNLTRTLLSYVFQIQLCGEYRRHHRKVKHIYLRSLPVRCLLANTTCSIRSTEGNAFKDHTLWKRSLAIQYIYGISRFMISYGTNHCVRSCFCIFRFSSTSGAKPNGRARLKTTSEHTGPLSCERGSNTQLE